MDSNPAALGRRVVVTGLGAVTAAGWGVPPLREAVRSGRTAIRQFDSFDHRGQRTHVAGQVPPGPPTRPGRRVPWSRLSNSDRFALFAAFEAAEQGGLPVPLDAHTTGVFFGSSTGGLLEFERYFEELVQKPGSRPPRALVASHSLSAPAETVARHLGVRGPVETVSSACASGGLAVEQALRALRAGEVDLAFAGGADCLCLTTYSGFNALRAVDERPCRPFRADRAGMSLGEGGAALLLELLDHARARRARPLAEVLGAGSSCDANHMTAPHAEGLGAAVALERALADAGLKPDVIDFVNAHGTGTPLNDVAEWAALLRVFGERARRIPMEATKGVLGHLLGAAGVVEAVSAILGLLAGEVHPAPGGGEVDPALPVDLVLGRPRPLPGMRTAVSVSLGFGGANAALVLGRWEES
jgi:3-oxoacyl-[acyl-carrier-protein] synthase II